MWSDHAFVVVLAGGRGERFWPLSTGARPKAFLRLVGDESLLQATVRRARLVLPWDRILVVAGRAHADLVGAQLPELPEGNLLLEPVGKDTAAAVGLASLALERRDPEAAMAVVPADHHVPDREALAAVLRRAFGLIESDPARVVTIGIRPTRPEIGYGYLEAREGLADAPGVLRVRQFLEKPGLDTVWSLLQEGGYYWNSGMFVWRGATFQALLARYMPEAWAGFRRIRDAWGAHDVLAREFSQFPRLSVDYGVLERMDSGVVMIPAEFAWDDLGSWDALGRMLPAEENGNVIIGEVRSLDTSDSIIIASDQQVATLGVSNVIVVASPHGVLVCSRGRSQDVRRLVGEAR
jgi:mannose-1-phosphate guanylyltransferase